MARAMTPAAAAQLALQVKALALFMEGEFRSGVARLWTGLGTISWNGNNWLGTGGFVEVQGAPETEDIAAQTMSVTVSGADPTLLADALNEGGHNFTGRLWLGMLDASGAIIADPILLYGGLLDSLTLTEAVAGPTIVVSYQNRLADLERPRSLYYTDTDQQRLVPGDLGFQFVPMTLEWSGSWGTANPSPPPQTGSFSSVVAQVLGPH